MNRKIKVIDPEGGVRRDFKLLTSLYSINKIIVGFSAEPPLRPLRLGVRRGFVGVFYP